MNDKGAIIVSVKCEEFFSEYISSTKIKKGFRRSAENPVISMVGDRRIELLTSSVSRKRSTSELIAQRREILHADGACVNTKYC